MKRIIFACGIILTLFGCTTAEKKYGSVAETDVLNTDSFTADSTLTQKIIKTADMQFRVKDVQSTKEKLSETIKAVGGTVAEFSIQSQIIESNKVKQSLDSMKEITSYRTEGYLVAKVPSEKLDDFTNTIAKTAVFVDNESMKMDDQSIAYLANTLKAENRIEAVKRMNKLATKKSPNVETALIIKDDFIDKKIENLVINDRVKFSTIRLSFYQDNTVKTTMVGNDNLYDYRPGFFDRLWLGLVNGWTIFKEFLLIISNLWMLILCGGLIFYLIRLYRTSRAAKI
ncbi:DUF4349 domain-containing protein [Pedobacter sp. MW01-1-1]|uniref:DUF4349 domain-containing protein n=1 Tax=Pedobacter sp. MW01-1-1 TaxID=3383027 RepID=UPI003FEE08F9